MAEGKFCRTPQGFPSHIPPLPGAFLSTVSEHCLFSP